MNFKNVLILFGSNLNIECDMKEEETHTSDPILLEPHGHHMFKATQKIKAIATKEGEGLESTFGQQKNRTFDSVCFWRDSPQWARVSSSLRFLDHIRRRTTVGRTPLDE